MGCFLPPCKGSELKLNVTADLPGGLHLADVDFYCDFMASMGKHRIVKSEMTMLDSDNYVAIINTSKTGSGELHMRLHVKLPDADMPDGVRNEIITIPTGIGIK